MAIVFNCPHCQHLYRLKDEFAGKQAKCKNAECRQLITIPKPPDAAELEAAALSALSDEAPKKEQQQAEAPPAEKRIEVTCKFCDHKWTEPWAKAGKNALCPNPECRRPNKVPEPKEDKPTDWRQTKTKLPSGAKQNFEKLEGVQDAGDVKLVHGKSLEEAGATGIEYEPRPLKDKIFIVGSVVGLLAALGFGIWYWRNSAVKSGDDQLLVDARAEFDTAAKELAPAQAVVCSAMLNAAHGEYAVRQDKPEELKKAHDLFAKARTELSKVTGPDRNAMVSELVLGILILGGTDEQVNDQKRYRWVPSTDSRALRATERPRTVHEELRQTMSLLSGTERELKLAVARRLARELTKQGQTSLAAELIPGLTMFTDTEQYEARAVVALEIYRTDPNSSEPRRVAEELRDQLRSLNRLGSAPAAVCTLWAILNIEKAGPMPPLPAGTAQLDQRTRLAQVGLRLLKGDADDALAVARRAGGQAQDRLSALLLCAEWSPAPGPALDAAQSVIAEMKGKADAYQVLRLSQLAAAAGRHEQAAALADAIPEEGLKAWAKGDAVRIRVLANPKEKADETWVEVPGDPTRVRAGHAWGRLWVARQNARVSGDRDAEKKATDSWVPTPIHPFALAGIALGLLDR